VPADRRRARGYDTMFSLCTTSCATRKPVRSPTDVRVCSSWSSSLPALCVFVFVVVGVCILICLDQPPGARPNHWSAVAACGVGLLQSVYGVIPPGAHPNHLFVHHVCFSNCILIHRIIIWVVCFCVLPRTKSMAGRRTLITCPERYLRRFSCRFRTGGRF